MKLALWIGLFVSGLAGVAVPLCYRQFAAQLPSLESEEDLRAALRSEPPEPGKDAVPFASFADVPREALAAYVSQTGCPEYFHSAREDGVAWLSRMLVGIWSIELAGDGRCERHFAARIAGALGLVKGPSHWVAVNKIHRLLQKDELIAYDLSTTAFEPSVVGLEAAAKALFRKGLKELQLAENAELMLALPPFALYEELKKCRNPSVIRQNRDYLLSMLVTEALVSVETVQVAQSRPVACTRN